MKLHEIVTGFNTLKKFAQIRFTSYQKAREVYKLLKAAGEEYSFYAAEEMKAAEQCAERDSNGNLIISDTGILKFKDENAARKYKNAITDLLNLETGTEIKKIDITEADFTEFPTPEEMAKLEAFIDFN